MASRVNRPDQAPDPDGGNDLKSVFDVLIESIPALKTSIDKQSVIMQEQLDLQTRMAAPGAGRAEAMGHVGGVMAQYRPRMREDVLKHLTATGGIPADVTMGMTKMTGMGALTSLQNLHAYGAQRLGEMIAGIPLYNPEQKGLPSLDVTPAGTTPRRPRRSVAQAVAQGAAATPGEAPVPGQAAAPADAGGSTAAILAAATGAAVKGAVEAEQEGGPGRLGELGLNVAAAAGAKIPRPEAPILPAPSEAQPAVAQPPGGAAQPPQGAPGRMTPPPPTSQMPPPSGSGGGGGGPGGPGGGGPGAPGGGGPGGGAPGAGGPGGNASWMTAARQNLGARVAMTGGTPGGFLGMLKKVPFLGLGIDIANKVADVYTSQREAGRMYQETEGGTNLGAQTERLHALAYQASMFGRVPEGVAAQMFGDVTSMGFTQRAVGQGQQMQNRQSALNFMYHQYTANGVNPDQAAEILQTASQNATVSLKSVGDAMTTLSDVAGKAGTNAKQARNNFNDLLNTAIQAGAAGGAPQLAGGQAVTQASYGNAFAKTSFAGISGAGMQYMLAGQSGMTPAAIQYTQRTNPAGYNALASASEQQFISQLPGMTPAMISDLQSMVAAAGGTAAIKQQPALVAQISTQFLNKYQVQANIDLNVWASVLSQLTSVPLTPANVMAYVVENVGGNTLASNSGAGAAGGAAGGGGGGPGGSVSAGRTGGAAAGKFGLAKPVGGTGVLGHVLGALSTLLPGGQVGPDVHGGSTWQQVLQHGPSGPGAANTYLGAERKSGKRNPVLEALIQNVPKGAQVAVQTASGTRVMSFEDAMKNFPNEMEAGNVQFYDSGGKNLGTTGNITQGLTDPGASVTGEQASKSRAGVSLSQYQKQHPQAGGSGVTQQIGLTSEAKQLLKLLPSNSDNAAAAATAPSNPLPSSSSR